MKEQESFQQNLLPSLIQCFGIIFIGYVFGRAKILQHQGAKGLLVFVQYLSLPALIFTTVATISFSNVQWPFIASVFVTKSIIFIAVALTTMILTKPIHLGKAGIYGIAATQSNDLALGYPLLVSLYKNTHPNFPSLLYIIAPIQLLIMNPIGFFMLELYKQRSDPQYIRQHTLISTVKGILTNPIIATTILGIIWNLAFNHSIPPAINQLLEALSSAFSATALFILGNNMANRVKLSNQKFSLVPGLLVLTKLLITPIVMQKITVSMLQGYSDTEIKDFSSFGFLYGTIPSAPSVFVFAGQYDVSVDIITSTIIFSTLFSAPLMLTSATMISIKEYGIENIKFYLAQTISFTSSINLFCCIWLFIVFRISNRWRNVSYGTTIYLMVSQLIMSVGGILLFFVIKTKSFFYVQYILSTTGMFSTRIFTAFLAVLLFLLQWRSLCFILRAGYALNIVAFLFAIGSSAVIASSLLGYHDPKAQFGYAQNVATLVLTLICLVITTVCLIIQQKYKKVGYQILDGENSRTHNQIDENLTIQNDVVEQASIKYEDFTAKPSTSKFIPIDVEDLGSSFVIKTLHDELDMKDSNELYNSCDSRFECNIDQRKQCSDMIQNYERTVSHHEIGSNDRHQVLRHIILLLFLSSSMLVNIAVCLWKLAMESTCGIFVELEFLDVILNYGQGVICFIIFGLDPDILDPIFKYLRQKKYYESGQFLLPDLDKLSTETVRICEQFETYHQAKCREQIGKVITVAETEHTNAFTGQDFVDWLLKVGLSQKRNKAEEYGEHLVLGRIIQSANQWQHFSDNVHVYKFVL